MDQQADASYSPEVIASYVWDAIRELPGLADLHRSPLQTLGERVHIERHGPVRLTIDDDRATLDVHIVVTPEASVPRLTTALREAITAYLERMTGIRLAVVNVHVDDIAWEQPAAP